MYKQKKARVPGEKHNSLTCIQRHFFQDPIRSSVCRQTYLDMVLGVERGPQNPIDQICIIDNEDRQNTDNDDDKHNEHHSDCDHNELRSKYLWW